MAHQLENSKDMFYVGETPWHGLGTRLESRPTSAEAIVAANLDWEVGLKPLCTYEDGEDGAMLADAKVSHKAVYRKTDGKILGVVGPGTHPLQNRDAFKFFDPFVVGGQAAYETAGQLQDGKRVWILAELSNDPMVIVPGANDVVKQYLLLSNAHDGTRAITVGYTPIRVVCANTLAMAHESAGSKLVKIRHHGTATEALEKIADTMNLVKKNFEATAEQYRFLAAKGCDEATLKKYVNLVFAPRRVERSIAKKAGVASFASLVIAEAMTEEAIDVAQGLEAEELRSNVYPKVLELFETGRGNALPGVRGTLWGAYNAISEYIVHERGKDAAKRLESAWFGQGAVQNDRALKVGVKLASV